MIIEHLEAEKKRHYDGGGRYCEEVQAITNKINKYKRQLKEIL